MSRLLLLLLCLGLRLPLWAQEPALFPYQQGTRWGYADAADRVIIQPVYQYAEPFRGGLGKVWRAGKCGYVNTQGREVIPPRWDAASYQDSLTDDLNRTLAPTTVAWAARQRWVIVLRYDSTLVPAAYAQREQPWRPGRPSGTPPDARRIGFFTAQGQPVLPARYVDFRPLTPDYYAARLVAGYYWEQEQTGCVRAPRRRPDYSEHLVHRSGRLVLGTWQLGYIRELRGRQLLVTDPLQTDRSQLLDTTGAPLLPTPGTTPEALQPLTPDWQLWAAAAGYTWPDANGQRTAMHQLLRPDGTPVTRQLFGELRALRDGSALLATTVQARRRSGTGVYQPAADCWLIPPVYGSVAESGAYFVVRALGFLQLPGRFGVIDSLGREVVPLRYRYLERCRTTTGCLLSAWYAETEQGPELLDGRGRRLLRLPRRAQLQPGGFDEHGQARLWMAKLRRARLLTIRPTSTGGQAVLTRRYRPAPSR